MYSIGFGTHVTLGDIDPWPVFGTYGSFCCIWGRNNHYFGWNGAIKRSDGGDLGYNTYKRREWRLVRRDMVYCNIFCIFVLPGTYLNSIVETISK